VEDWGFHLGIRWLEYLPRCLEGHLQSDLYTSSTESDVLSDLLVIDRLYVVNEDVARPPRVNEDAVDFCDKC